MTLWPRSKTMARSIRPAGISNLGAARHCEQYRRRANARQPKSGRRKLRVTRQDLRAAPDSRFLLTRDNAINQAHLPTAFVPIDPHGNFSFGRRAFDSIFKDKKVGTKIENRQ